MIQQAISNAHPAFSLSELFACLLFSFFLFDKFGPPLNLIGFRSCGVTLQKSARAKQIYREFGTTQHGYIAYC